MSDSRATMYEPLAVALATEVQDWRRRGLERVLRAAWNRAGAEVETADGIAVDFSSNDYLGLSTDARVHSAMRAALDSGGIGATASRLIAGNHPEHEALEEELARFFEAPATLTFSTGFAANTGTIPALVERGDVIFADALNHASLIDGCRLSRADVYVFRHSDMDDLRRLLQLHRGGARRAMIVSDGLFSMDGDCAELAAIIDLAREFDAWTYVDDAHAVGAIGVNGRGTAEYLGLHGHVDVTVGTLGKAFGVAGAFVYGAEVLRRHLMNRARSFVYSTAAPPALAAAARAAVRLVSLEPERRARLESNARRVRAAMRVAGSRVAFHIVPVIVGDPAETLRVAAMLRAAGVLVGAVRPPTVSHGSSRLRVSVSAAHTDAHIERLATALAEARTRE